MVLPEQSSGCRLDTAPQVFPGRGYRIRISRLESMAIGNGASVMGRVAVLKDAGQGFELQQYEVPEPEPGAMVIKVSMAGVCGSDLHAWRGDIEDSAPWGAVARRWGDAGPRDGRLRLLPGAGRHVRRLGPAAARGRPHLPHAKPGLLPLPRVYPRPLQPLPKPSRVCSGPPANGPTSPGRSPTTTICLPSILFTASPMSFPIISSLPSTAPCRRSCKG